MKEVETLRNQNPYLSRFVDSINTVFPVLNIGEKTKGFLNVFKYLYKCDLFFLNWIENLAWYNLPFFYTFLVLARFHKKRVVWIHHNLEPHGGSSTSSKLILHAMQRYSSKIIIHTKESLKSLAPNCHAKCVYILHPYFDKLHLRKDVNKYDLLIWGSIRKSKGVLEFLKYLSETSTSLKILVIGKFSDQNYLEEVLKYVENDVRFEIENRFIADAEFYDIHSLAKRILFIYNGPSVLNSGALIKSLSSGKAIIGPDRGAFIDYKNLGLIDTFRSFDDILKIMNADGVVDNRRLLDLENSISENSWDQFAKKIKEVTL